MRTCTWNHSYGGTLHATSFFSYKRSVVATCSITGDPSRCDPNETKFTSTNRSLRLSRSHNFLPYVHFLIWNKTLFAKLGNCKQYVRYIKSRINGLVRLIHVVYYTQ